MKMDFNESAAASVAEGVGDAFPLDRARPGAEVVVDHVDHEGAPAGRRLIDLGLLPDTIIRVVRRAPLGDPTEYALRGYRLCLRRGDAASIWVRRRVEQSPSDA